MMVRGLYMKEDAKEKILIITDTLLGAAGMKNLILSSKKEAKIKIIDFDDVTLDKIQKFCPSTIINYRYKTQQVGNDALVFFMRKPEVKLISFNLNDNKMTVYSRTIQVDANVEDLFSSLKSQEIH